MQNFTSKPSTPLSAETTAILETAETKAATAAATKAANKAAAAAPAKPAPKRKPKPAANAKPKPNAKPKRKPATAAPAAAPAEPTFHAASGLKSRVARLRNANRKTAIYLCAAKSPDKISSDKQRALYDLRATYSKPFPARGLDNGILRDLLASKLIKTTGGASATINGKPYLIDGDKPVMLSFTAAGQAYGKA